MKVLLTETIPNLGKIGDIVDVKRGYARNYLLPQAKATLPTPENIRQVELQKERYLAKLAKEKEEFLLLAQKLEDFSLTIRMKVANEEEGILYGSVTVPIIVKSLEEEGIKVSPKWLQLQNPIKELGCYKIEVNMPHEVTSILEVWVVPEN
ncbi:MAG: 50S ribosomal protein L9 [Planctomycetota bacterium]|nr:MAG: 50S ribosomal protein L9 [Planctomycetota bacterium]